MARGRRRRLDLHVRYDEEADVLYVGRAGQEEQVVELYAGVNLELSVGGELIGVEILRASQLLQRVSEPLRWRALGDEHVDVGD